MKKCSPLFATLLLSACILTACGGGGGGTPPPAVTISVSPSSAVVIVSTSQQFTATVSNTTNTSVTWSVNGTAGGNATVGTISSAGLYLAPVTVPNPTSVTVTAISQADTTKSASASVSLTYPAPTVVAVGPSSGTVGSDTRVNVIGRNFVSLSVINFNGANVSTTFVSSTELTATLPTSSLAAGTYPLTVVNPGPGGGTSNSVNFTVSPPAASISGTAVDGTISGATVTVTAVNADGTDGNVLGTATTDGSGNFSVPLSPAPSGPIRVTVNGGTSTSLATGKTVANTSKLRAILDSVAGNTSGVAVTPLTEFVNSLTVGSLTSGGSIRADDERPAKTLPPLATVHAVANAKLVAFAGLPAGTASESVSPVFTKIGATTNPSGFTLGLFLGSLSQQGTVLVPSSPTDLIPALSSDISDGVFDGKNPGSPIPLGSGTLPITAGNTDLLTSLNSYAISGNAIVSNGLTVSDVEPLATPLFKGVTRSTATPPSAGLTPGSSAALTGFSFDGHQYIFMAGRTKGIIVLDVTNPAAVTAKAWPCLATSTFSVNFVSGVVPVVGTAPHPQVLAYAIALPHIALLNAEVLATGTPPTTLTCPSSLVDLETDLTISNPPVPFKDGNTTVLSGGIPDNGNRGVWLATSDGYAFLDLTLSPPARTTVFPVDGGQQLAENMGGDIVHNQILAGNYVGMQLIDLSLQKSFDMDSSFFKTNIVPLAPSDFVATNSVDTALQVAIGTAEDVGNSFFINLATLSEDTANSTFMPAATNGFAVVQMSVDPATGLDLTGASADASSHLVLFGSESNPGLSAWVAVGQLQDPASIPAGSTWAGMTDWVMWNIINSPSIAVGSDTFFPSSDPPVFGAMFNLGAGKPFGFLLTSDDSFVVQVDMQGLLNMTRAGTSGDAAHEPATDPALSGFLKVITGF